mmetsp:Transcript_53779/g.141813  ORF Transcript_53779/g.141813 Transcript_53779/m.141813 type:complete len:304 (-) Transcript_53779:1182-2093(-)
MSLSSPLARERQTTPNAPRPMTSKSSKVRLPISASRPDLRGASLTTTPSSLSAGTSTGSGCVCGLSSSTLPSTARVRLPLFGAGFEGGEPARGPLRAGVTGDPGAVGDEPGTLRRSRLRDRGVKVFRPCELCEAGECSAAFAVVAATAMAAKDCEVELPKGVGPSLAVSLGCLARGELGGVVIESCGCSFVIEMRLLQLTGEVASAPRRCDWAPLMARGRDQCDELVLWHFGDASDVCGFDGVPLLDAVGLCAGVLRDDGEASRASPSWWSLEIGSCCSCMCCEASCRPLPYFAVTASCLSRR